MDNRLRYFQNKLYLNRFWWFRDNDYLPDIYRRLSNEEWEVCEAYFEATERRRLFGECNVPLMSEMLGYINGSNLDKIVQLGHFAGWSTLMMGWELRRMGKTSNCLWSIDIMQGVTDFALQWVINAGLQDIVRLQVGDSIFPDAWKFASSYLNGEPKMIFVDSSHEYEHTGKEIAYWYPHLRTGGLMFFHDASEYASKFDGTQRGGVKRAIEEFWASPTLSYKRIRPGILMLNHYVDGTEPLLVRQDGCGAGVIQKW